MKAKVTIIVEYNNEKSFYSDEKINANYNDAVDLIIDVSEKACEEFEQKRLDEIDEDDEFLNKFYFYI